jgi:uroporphyrin-III C-methyltransferase/precorrin-2 dehydrogenase/sirohydrochlorin ferrochelatase
MGKKSARFIQGRLLMHGANRHMAVTVIENASRPEQRILETTLDALPTALAAAKMTGPALTFLGLAPRAAQTAVADPDNRFTEPHSAQEAL